MAQPPRKKLALTPKSQTFSLADPGNLLELQKNTPVKQKTTEQTQRNNIAMTPGGTQERLPSLKLESYSIIPQSIHIKG